MTDDIISDAATPTSPTSADAKVADASHLASIIEACRNGDSWRNGDIAWCIIAAGYRRTPPVVQPAGAEAELREAREDVRWVHHHIKNDVAGPIAAVLLRAMSRIDAALATTSPVPQVVAGPGLVLERQPVTGALVATPAPAPASAAGDCLRRCADEIEAMSQHYPDFGPPYRKAVALSEEARRLSAAPADERRGEEMRGVFRWAENVCASDWSDSDDDAVYCVDRLREALKRAGGRP